MASVRGIAVVGVLALSGVFVVASAPPAAAAVTVTVDPSTGLADGQPVTVTGDGFAPGASVGAAECSAAVAQSRNTNDCDLSSAPIVPADSAGHAVIHLRVRRTINTANGSVDCLTAPNPCVIGMADTSDVSNPDKGGGMAITFDPNAPPEPPPDVSLTPSGDLVDRQQVAVYATGFIPGEFVLVTQCAAQNLDKNPCNEGFQFGGNGGQADPTGAIAVGLTVRRAVRVNGERFDCASAVGACVVVVQANGGPAGSAPLSFDASVPLPPPPTMTVTPSDALADGQIVHVQGSGFRPNAPLAIQQCPSDMSPQFGCYSGYGRSFQADANGSFSTAIEAERSLQAFGPKGPTTVDCAEASGRCVINAIDYNDDLDSATVPLSFDAAKPPAPPPTASASPDTALVDGQSVTIRADGFPPGAGLFLVQCVAGSTDASGCDVSNLGNAMTDDNGHLEASYVVHRFLTLGPPVVPPPTVPVGAPAEKSDGQSSPAASAFFVHPTADPSTFDCASAPGACVLSVAFLGGNQIEAAGAPLTFDASAPSPSTSTVPPDSNQPADASNNASSTATDSTSSSSSGQTVNGAPLPRTGTDVHSRLRLDLVLMIVGAVALTCAGALRARARRRAAA